MPYRPHSLGIEVDQRGVVAQDAIAASRGHWLSVDQHVAVGPSLAARTSLTRPPSPARRATFAERLGDGRGLAGADPPLSLLGSLQRPLTRPSWTQKGGPPSVAS